MKKEIFSSCCAFGGMAEEIHVLKCDCPIKRELGARESKGNEEVTCYYRSFRGLVVPPCAHYRGTKKVKRKGETKHKVFCTALEE